MSGEKIVRLGRDSGGEEAAAPLLGVSALAAPPEPPTLDTALDLAAPVDRHPGDRAFLPAALAMVESPPHRVTVVLGCAISALVIGAVALAC